MYSCYIRLPQIGDQAKMCVTQNPVKFESFQFKCSYNICLILQEMQWKGLRHGSVFQRPKANVLVTVLTTEVQPELNVKGKAEFPVQMVTVSF